VFDRPHREQDDETDAFGILKYPITLSNYNHSDVPERMQFE
jgi:hypothetical protein